MVTSLLPAANALAAPRSTAVMVGFDQALSTSQATRQALQVFSQQAGGKKAGTATVSGGKLTFAPTTAFRPGETVFSTLTAAAQSASGNPATPYVFQFTTATSPSTGTFSGGSDVAVGEVPQTAVLGDVDGDLDLDLLTGGLSARTVSIRLNERRSGSIYRWPGACRGRCPKQYTAKRPGWGRRLRRNALILQLP